MIVFGICKTPSVRQTRSFCASVWASNRSSLGAQDTSARDVQLDDAPSHAIMFVGLSTFTTAPVRKHRLDPSTNWFTKPCEAGPQISKVVVFRKKNHVTDIKGYHHHHPSHI